MDSFYITIEDAMELLKKDLFSLEIIKVPVKHSFSYILVENFYSLIDPPSFYKFCNGGYTVRFKESEDNNLFILKNGKIKIVDFKR